MPKTLDPTQVQFVLDTKTPGEDPVEVIFIKVNGDQRKLRGYLIPGGTSNKGAVPIDTPEGIRSFRIDSVLSIT